MKVHELISLLEKVPAGARVIAGTRKPIDELLADNLLDDDENAEIYFFVKIGGYRKNGNGEVGEFELRF